MFKDRELIMIAGLIISIYVIYIAAQLNVCAALFFRKHDKRGWMVNYISFTMILVFWESLIKCASSPFDFNVSQIYQKLMLLFYFLWEMLRVVKVTLEALNENTAILKWILNLMKKEIFMLMVIGITYLGTGTFSRIAGGILNNLYLLLLESENLLLTTTLLIAGTTLLGIHLMERYADTVNHVYQDENGNLKLSLVTGELNNYPKNEGMKEEYK